MMTPIDAVPCYPLGAESCLQGMPQHACSQLWFRGKAHLFWHIGFSTSLSIVRPPLGQIQFPIHKGVTCLGCIRQKDPNLAVFYPSCRSTILSLYPDRLLPFFEEARFIRDVDSIGISVHLVGVGCQWITHLVALPHASVYHALHGIRS